MLSNEFFENSNDEHRRFRTASATLNPKQPKIGCRASLDGSMLLTKHYPSLEPHIFLFWLFEWNTFSVCMRTDCELQDVFKLYLIWRAVDLLVQVELTGEYEHSPMVTADNTLTLLKKETGIG
jgi:hypothetical protein